MNVSYSFAENSGGSPGATWESRRDTNEEENTSEVIKMRIHFMSVHPIPSTHIYQAPTMYQKFTKPWDFKDKRKIAPAS